MLNSIRTHNVCNNWASFVKRELYSLGLGYYWDNQYVINAKCFISQVKTRLFNIFKQHCISQLESSNKCILYRQLVTMFDLQYYLRKGNILTKHKHTLCKFRISAHNLNIERGRYHNVPRHERKCQLCNMNDIEDEYHFIFICPLYYDIRLKYIKPYYFRYPSMLKLIQIFTSQSVKVLSNLAKYLTHANKRREHLID